MTLTNSHNYVQTKLWSLLSPDQTNCQALYDLAPRFIHRVERKDGSAFLSIIKKEFMFNGELYSVTVTPARIVGTDGKERDELPGEREQLVEDVIRRLAADKMMIASDQIEIPYTVYAIRKELVQYGHSFSWTEIKEALLILNKSNIEITRVVGEGDKKIKPVLSASAFPVLRFADTNDGEHFGIVQLNPLLVQSIKSLAFEQINYEWMMSIKGPLPRWIFKYISLLVSNKDADANCIRLHASEIAKSFGHIRARLRATLGEVDKAIERLKEVEVIKDYDKRDVYEGKKKVDVVYDLHFSPQFIADRQRARTRTSFVKAEATKVNLTPTKLMEMSESESVQLSIDFKEAMSKNLETHH